MDEHRLETRAHLLAEGIQHSREVLRDSLAPPGRRPPFSAQLPRADALDWWRKHRRDALGAKALAAMRPEAIMALDQALSQQIEAESFAPPVEEEAGYGP